MKILGISGKRKKKVVILSEMLLFFLKITVYTVIVSLCVENELLFSFHGRRVQSDESLPEMQEDSGFWITGVKDEEVL